MSSDGVGGPESIVVSGVLSSKVTRSSGGPSVSFSRLLMDCSSPTPFSVASRIRKPWLPETYRPRVCSVTSHCSGPCPDGVVAAGPVSSRLVVPGDAALRPGGRDLPGLQRAAILRRRRLQPQHSRGDGGAAVRQRGQREARQSTRVVAALGPHLQRGVGAGVAGRAALADPAVRLGRQAVLAGRALHREGRAVAVVEHQQELGRAVRALLTAVEALRAAAVLGPVPDQEAVCPRGHTCRGSG